MPMIYHHAPLRQSRKLKGLSLVELMITMVISIVILTGVMGYYLSSLRSNRFANENSRLNQELNGAMEVMVRDLRRAGYWGAAEQGLGSDSSGALNYFQNPFNTIVGNNDGGIVTPSSNCVLFVYDRDTNGSKSGETFGFKLSNGAVHMLTTPATPVSCDSGTWQPITDSQFSSVNSLVFQLTYPLIESLSNGYACTREIAITLTGQLVSDSSVTQTLNQIVRVRADRYSNTSC